MRKIKVVGLTGQTGAGKTRVAELLRQTGIPVIDADEVSRFVVEKNQMLVAELALAFGVGILDVDGKLVRKSSVASSLATRRSSICWAASFTPTSGRGRQPGCGSSGGRGDHGGAGRSHPL